MNFLLDTNVISESIRPQPNPGVAIWLERVDEQAVYLSVVTWAELRHGITRLEPGQRQRRLRSWLEAELPRRFYERIIPVDLAIADAWGILSARREAAGRAMNPMDGLLAATAEVHALTLVTRNVRDFEGAVPLLFSPWQ